MLFFDFFLYFLLQVFSEIDQVQVFRRFAVVIFVLKHENNKAQDDDFIFYNLIL